MDIFYRTIKIPSKTQFVNPYFIGDQHFGAASFDEGCWKYIVGLVKDDPYAAVFLMGDTIEAIIKGDAKRWAQKALHRYFTDKIDNLPAAQVHYAADHIAPIADKCVLIHEGNHEESLKRHIDYDATAELANEIKLRTGCEIPVAYGEAQTVIHIDTEKKGEDGYSKGKSRTLIVDTSHGSGGGEQKGGVVNKLDRISSNNQADIIVRGHSHFINAWCDITLTTPRRGAKGKLIPIPRVKGISGCFFKTNPKGITTYGEKRDLRPTAMGALRVSWRWEPMIVMPTPIIYFSEDFETQSKIFQPQKIRG